MKKNILITAVLAALLSGCSTSLPDMNSFNMNSKKTTKIQYSKINPSKASDFKKDFNAVAKKTTTDPKYTRMGLGNNKEWFKSITYMLWNRELSKEAYIREGLTRYPNSQYEFSFVANNI